MTTDVHGTRSLVTGGAGFIGSYIADQLLAGGATSVVILDDFSRGRFANIEQAAATGRLEVVDGDVRDTALLNQVTAGCDFVFHQAALRITQSAEEPVKAIDIMVNATQFIIEAALQHNVRKVLYASSASVYGEASYLPMDEAHPFNNRTIYGAAKIAGEQILRSYADMKGLQYAGIRPFNVYGPRMDVHGVYTEVMIRWLDRLSRGEAPLIFGDGTQTMDFIYVEDLARAYVLAATSDATDIVVNGGSGTETSLGELCELLCTATGHPEISPEMHPPRQVNAVTRRKASTELAEKVLGFRTTTDLRTGLGRLIDWHAEIHDIAPALSTP